MDNGFTDILIFTTGNLTVEQFNDIWGILSDHYVNFDENKTRIIFLSILIKHMVS